MYRHCKRISDYNNGRDVDMKYNKYGVFILFIINLFRFPFAKKQELITDWARRIL